MKTINETKNLNTLIAIVPIELWSEVEELESFGYSYEVKVCDTEVALRRIIPNDNEERSVEIVLPKEEDSNLDLTKDYSLPYLILELQGATELDGYDLYLELRSKSIGCQWSFGMVGNQPAIIDNKNPIVTQKSKLQQFMLPITEPKLHKDAFYLTFKTHCHRAKFIDARIYVSKQKKKSLIASLFSFFL